MKIMISSMNLQQEIQVYEKLNVFVFFKVILV